eukprot:bmy_12528T0
MSHSDSSFSTRFRCPLYVVSMTTTLPGRIRDFSELPQHHLTSTHAILLFLYFIVSNIIYYTHFIIICIIFIYFSFYCNPLFSCLNHPPNFQF